jgi:hypothetical protein
MKTRIPTELQEQIGFYSWFSKKFPDILCFHIPNGGWRDINTAKKLKASGVVRGIPDLFIPSLKIFVEMKRVKGGVVSPEQKKMMAYLERVGYKVILAKGATDASIQVLNFLKEKQ